MACRWAMRRNRSREEHRERAKFYQRRARQRVSLYGDQREAMMGPLLRESPKFRRAPIPDFNPIPIQPLPRLVPRDDIDEKNPRYSCGMF